MNNQRGASLILIVLGISLFSAVMLGYSLSNANINYRMLNATHSNAKESVEHLKESLFFLLSNPIIWNQVVSDNTTLSCVKDSVDCTNRDYQQIQKVEFSGVIYITDLDPKFGYSVSGEICHKYDDIYDNNCIFKPILMWKPKCTDPLPAECINSPKTLQLKIEIKPAYAQKTNLYVNEDTFEYELN